ncbi:hypothetical protein ID866_1084 [Astraeus odoratus]|nr:hypothetical protein ID866_1084 [Astraeus odoratus]
MSSYIEILHFTVCEGFEPVPVNDELRKLLSKAEGLNGQVASLLFVVIDFASKDAHARFLASPDGFAFEQALTALSASPFVRYCAEFEEAESRLNAPITEFVTFTLKEDNRMDQLEPLVHELQEKLLRSKMFYGSSWAPIANRPNMYNGLLGWITVEAHWDAVKDGPPKEVIDRIKQIADLWLVHAALKPLTKSK